MPIRLTAWLAAGWAATAVTAAVVLGVSGAAAGTWPEEAHVVGHLGLCSVLAVLVAQSWPTTRPAVAAIGAFAVTVAFGAVIEAVQLRYAPHWTEVLYDLLTDGLGATLGLLAWASADRERREPVGHVLSAVLHPLFVAPLGLAMALYAAERSGGTALRWTAAATACVAPAVGFWVLGILLRWWSDADVSRRAERPVLFASGIASALAFGALSTRGPDAALALALLCLAGALLGAAITVAGLKVSGHVAIPAALGLAMLPWSGRGPWLLLAVALVLSWARIAASRHERIEVAAAWALATALGLGLALGISLLPSLA